jgi:nitroreductase
VDVYQAIKQRFSARFYKPDPPPDEVIQRLLEATRMAPSSNNSQPWKFVVVRDPETRRKLAEISRNQQFVGQAPIIIAAVATKTDHVMTCGLSSFIVDLAIAVDHLTLAAAAEGLGTCWIGAFYQDPARELLGVPEDCRIVALLPVGYPSRGAGTKRRKQIEEIVCYERFSG